MVIPPRPLLGSCLCLLSAHIQSAAVQTVSSKIDDLDYDKISETIDVLSVRVMEDIVAQGIDSETVELTTLMDLCYVGQATELTIPLSGNPAEAESFRKTLEHFHTEHARVYGYLYVNEQPVKVVNVRVRGIGPLRPIVLPVIESGSQSVEDAKTGSREVYFGPDDGVQDTNVYDRNILISGTAFEGPAIVTEYDSTVLIPPGAKAEVDQYGNLLINL